MGKWLHSECESEYSKERSNVFSGERDQLQMDECNSELVQTKSDKVVGERP